MNRKKKENIFFIEKMKLFFYDQKKKKTNKRFFQKNKCLLYINTFFLEGREGVYFKLKYLLPYL